MIFITKYAKKGASIMNILYSSDNEFAQYAATSLTSLLSNNIDEEKIVIYYIDNKMNENNINLIEKVVSNYNRTIIFVDIDEVTKGFEKSDDYFLSSYARLFASRIPDLDKIIYIDCDTLITNSLSELWNIDLKGFLFAGVKDTISPQHALSIGLGKNHHYMNAGVLLMNVSLMRELDFPEHTIKLVRKNNGKIPHEDQGIINILARDRIKVIDPKYNLMPQFFMYTHEQICSLYNLIDFYNSENIIASINKPVIVHFINKLYGRPWEIDCTHPLKDKFIFTWQECVENIVIINKKHKLSYKTRRFVYKYAPFLLHYLLEKTLDIRRNRYIKKNHIVIVDEPL